MKNILLVTFLTAFSALPGSSFAQPNSARPGSTQSGSVQPGSAQPRSVHAGSALSRSFGGTASPRPFSLIPFALLGNSRTPGSSDSLLTQALSFIDSVFNRPDFTFDIAEPAIPKDMQSILIRFNNAVAADKQWFLDYRDKNAAGGSLPHNERFGITREEYQRVQNLERFPPRLITLSQQKASVDRHDGNIHFKGEGEIRILDYWEIDLRQQKIIFAGDTLPFGGTMIGNQLSPFGLTQGYVWRLEKADLKNTLQAGKVTARVVEIDLGLPKDTTKVFLRIKYQDMQEGITRAEMDLTGFVH
jgi:hypothetical protein